MYIKRGLLCDLEDGSIDKFGCTIHYEYAPNYHTYTGRFNSHILNDVILYKLG